MSPRLWLAAWLLAALAGCGALPDKPVASVRYDLGPLPGVAEAAAPAGMPLVLGEIEAGGSFERTALLYRLAYDHPQQLQPYSQARWSAPPAELLRQRIAEHLARERPVLEPSLAAGLAPRAGALPPELRLELQEFSQVFDSPQASRGVVRLRASVLERAPGGERLLGQRSFIAQRPAPTADAAGGVQALAAASDAAAQELAAWLRQLR